jgi:hypothetical protein
MVNIYVMLLCLAGVGGEEGGRSSFNSSLRSDKYTHNMQIKI